MPPIRLRATSGLLFGIINTNIVDTIPSGNFRTGHVGPAALPLVTPSHVSSNATTGTIHSPVGPAELATLLSGGDIGTGILSAGDTIVLTRGVCYNNSSYPRHTFPAITGAGTNPIRVISSDLSAISAPGVRRQLSHRASVPHFRCIQNNLAAFRILWGAEGWHFIGIEADAGTVTTIYGIVNVGPVADGSYLTSQTYGRGDVTYGGWVSLQNGNLNNPQVEGVWWTKLDASKLVNKIVFDRCDIAGRLHSNNCVIAVYLATREVIIKDSIIWSEGGPGLEDKGVLGVEFAGPMLFDNNLCVASAINFLTGGADPSFNVIPTDITVRRSHFYKPLRFINNQAEWDGLNRRHKNSFEFKVVKRALVEDCLFENHFDGTESQYYGIVFKCSNQDGTFNIAETSDVTFRYNRLKNMGGVFGVGAIDLYAGGTAVGCKRFSIYQNYTTTPAGALNPDGARSWLVQCSPEMDDLHMEACTMVGDLSTDIRSLAILSESVIGKVKWINMVTDYGHPDYGGITILGFSQRGKNVFTASGSQVLGSVMCTTGAPVDATTYGGSYSNPPFFVSTDPTAIYVNKTAGDYKLVSALETYGVGGFTPGADIDTINLRTIGCESGVWS